MISIIRIFSFLIFISFCNFETNENKAKNDLALMNLKGDVKKIIRNSYKENYPIADGNPYILSNDLSLFQEGERSDYEIDFTSSGNKKKHLTYSYSYKPGKRSVLNNIVYYYDKNNKLLKEEWLYWDKPSGKDYVSKTRLYEYNKDGQISLMKESRGKNIRNEYKYTYDEKGNLLKEEYIPSKKLKHIIVYEYDESNNKISEEKINKTKARSANPRDYKIIYKYDKLDRKIEQIEERMIRNFKESFTYSYNNSGNISSIVKIGPHEKIILNFEYQYDHENNWVKKIMKNNSEIIYQINREISYY
jgi:hypothetical protein